MKLEFVCKSEIGDNIGNDDRVLIPGGIFHRGVHRVVTEAPEVAAVCDGCGGVTGGDVAAVAVLQCLAEEDPQVLTDPVMLEVQLDRCEQAVEQEKLELPEFGNMCTTIAGCVFAEDCTLVFHSGDSRVYRYDGYDLTRMTSDHSPVQELVDMGILTAEQARVHPRRNVIRRAIGAHGEPPEIYRSNAPIGEGELYLMCSDGLWEVFPEEELEAMVSQGGDLEALAEALVQQALQRGSQDNISVCLCRRARNRNAVEK